MFFSNWAPNPPWRISFPPGFQPQLLWCLVILCQSLLWFGGAVLLIGSRGFSFAIDTCSLIIIFLVRLSVFSAFWCRSYKLIWREAVLSSVGREGWKRLVRNSRMLVSKTVGVNFCLPWVLALHHFLVKGLFSLLAFVSCSRMEWQSLVGRKVELRSQLK